MQKPRPSDDARTFSKITLLISALRFFFFFFTLSRLHYLRVIRTFKKLTRNIGHDRTTLWLDNWLQRQEEAATSNLDFKHC